MKRCASRCCVWPGIRGERERKFIILSPLSLLARAAAEEEEEEAQSCCFRSCTRRKKKIKFMEKIFPAYERLCLFAIAGEKKGIGSEQEKNTKNSFFS